MYLAFIHIGRYDIKARRHLACVQNGITQLGDWRMETWQLALRARCHVSIRQSPSCNAILNTCPCLLAIYTGLALKGLSMKDLNVRSKSCCGSGGQGVVEMNSTCTYFRRFHSFFYIIYTPLSKLHSRNHSDNMTSTMVQILMLKW